MLMTVVGFFGLLYGSFINVVIYRLARDLSVVGPRSYCPRCRRSISWHDNIPVISWVILRGRGRCCKEPISIRYPTVEIATAVLAMAVWDHWNGVSTVFAGAAGLACGALLALSVIDWETFMIPDELSLGLLALGLVVSLFNPYFEGIGEAWWSPLWLSARGALFGFGLGWGVAAIGEAVFKKEAFGGGDVKLLSGVGAWFGITGVFDCMMIGCFLGSIYGVWQIRRGLVHRSDPIPFGPFLAVGAAVNFFVLLPMGWPLM